MSNLQEIQCKIYEFPLAFRDYVGIVFGIIGTKIESDPSVGFKGDGTGELGGLSPYRSEGLIV